MTILTIKERFNQSSQGKKALKELQQQHKKSGTSFNWTKDRPNLDIKSDLISIDSLHIDTDTQRDPFDSARIKKLKRIVANPDPRHFKRIIVSNREWENGSQNNVVVEGQGRVLSAYAMGEKAVPYDLYTFASKREEAEFFLSQGKDVHTIKDWEKHGVILGLPHNSRYTQALDLQRVVDNTSVEYEPQKIVDVDGSRAYAGIRDSILRSEPAKGKTKAGQRTGKTTIEIINILVRHCKVKGETLVLRSDLFYPMTEFVLSYTKPSKGLKKLEEKIISLKQSNGGQVTLDDMAIACRLGMCKNANDKKARYKDIKGW